MVDFSFTWWSLSFVNSTPQLEGLPYRIQVLDGTKDTTSLLSALSTTWAAMPHFLASSACRQPSNSRARLI